MWNKAKLASVNIGSLSRESSRAEALEWWLLRLTTAMAEPDLALPPVKVFKPKHNLPVLLDYSQSAPVSFWEKLPRCESWPAKSRVKPTKIKALALTLGCSDRTCLKYCAWI
jgi:hypothetical protein